MSKITSFFLGANTPDGFVCFFDEFYNPYKSCSPYIIKGGPGTGKSTLMKKIGAVAEQKGYDTQYFYCSSDNKSLDCVCVPELDLSVLDGTSPHIFEPKFPGAVENIINPGDFWDKGKLKEKADEIRALTLENSIHHRRSSAYLAAAGKLSDENVKICRHYLKEDKLNSFAVRFAMREAKKKKGAAPGRKIKRFLSGITPNGIIFQGDTVNTLCSRIIGIEDERGAVSNLLCERCAEYVAQRGYDVILCYCPMRPHECEHIIIPELSLGILTIKKDHPIKNECDRLIHPSRFLHEGIKEHKQRLQLNRKIINELTNQSISCLKNAKSVHDKLEKIYIDAMNFDEFGKYADKIMQGMF